ncbi:MAG TPA: cell division protein SepF, partial [Candidatus Limnocylindrales bacterium]|nr:cell division protein SepF [Candidatus Limnocylindrales bacterium]
MKFSLFRKQKQETEAENPAEPAQEEPKQETAAAPEESKQETVPQEPAPTQGTVASVQESKTYLKAMPLKDVADVENVKNEIRNGNIIILRVTPLANKSIDDVKNAVNELYQFSESIGGDIARLGEERVVICP